MMDVLRLAEFAGLAHFDEVEVNGEKLLVAKIKMGAGTDQILKFAKLVKESVC
jgi:hypothetical protein